MNAIARNIRSYAILGYSFIHRLQLISAYLHLD